MKNLLNATVVVGRLGEVPIIIYIVNIYIYIIFNIYIYIIYIYVYSIIYIYIYIYPRDPWGGTQGTPGGTQGTLGCMKITPGVPGVYEDPPRGPWGV